MGRLRAARFNVKTAGGVMFGLGHWEILIILILVMIIFGAGKLPEIGSGLDVEADIKEEPEKIEAG